MIIVFGSNVLDMFFHVSDLPAKDTALFLDTHEEAPGGKGQNQAIAAATAGANVKFFGAVGHGGHGRALIRNMQDKGIDTEGVAVIDQPTSVAAIFVDDTDGTHKVVVSKGANLHVSQSSINDDLLAQDTIMILQGELPMAETEALIARGKQKGCRTVLNLAPYTFLSEAALTNLDVIVLNEHEANALAKQLGMNAYNKEGFAIDLAKKYDLHCIVTLGGNGSICAGKGEVRILNALQIKPVDTIGAGDAFVGYFSAALDAGESLDQALKWGAVAGSLACTKVGAQEALPLKDEVAQRLSEIAVATKSYE